MLCHLILKTTYPHFTTKENWGSEKLKDLPKVTQWMGGSRAGFEPGPDFESFTWFTCLFMKKSSASGTVLDSRDMAVNKVAKSPRAHWVYLLASGNKVCCRAWQSRVVLGNARAHVTEQGDPGECQGAWLRREPGQAARGGRTQGHWGRVNSRREDVVSSLLSRECLHLLSWLQAHQPPFWWLDCKRVFIL